MSKLRTRLCLKDIYRYIVTGDKVEILGLNDFEANRTEIKVMYEGRRRYSKFKAANEDARRDAIKVINKYISEVH